MCVYVCMYMYTGVCMCVCYYGSSGKEAPKSPWGMQGTLFRGGWDGAADSMIILTREVLTLSISLYGKSYACGISDVEKNYKSQPAFFSSFSLRIFKELVGIRILADTWLGLWSCTNFSSLSSVFY